MVIFNSYVKLPEGKSISMESISMESDVGNPWLSKPLDFNGGFLNIARQTHWHFSQSLFMVAGNRDCHMY